MSELSRVERLAFELSRPRQESFTVDPYVTLTWDEDGSEHKATFHKRYLDLAAKALAWADNE